VLVMDKLRFGGNGGGADGWPAVLTPDGAPSDRPMPAPMPLSALAWGN
jgi:hypothetical protein